MVIVINMLLRQKDTGITYRVVDTVGGESVAKDDVADHVVLINTDPDCVQMPRFMRQDEVIERLATKSWQVAKDSQRSIDLAALSDPERRNLERRWSILQQALKSRVNLYDPSTRAHLARKFADQKIASRPLLYQTLRLYWRHGAGKQSLVPDFHTCGAPGKGRVPTELSKKVGRKRTTQPGVGLILTAEHRRRIARAFAKTPVGRNGRGMRNVYNYLLISQYPQCVQIDPNDPDGTPTILLPDAVPTIDQMMYQWTTQHTLATRLQKRFSKRRFENLTKLLLTGTLREVRGPGARYYIDATIADVYIVSRYNRNRIIGRPTLYLVVDQFSRLIVGIYVGLEPPCWVGAMLALWNCSIDKVGYCARYGISITSGQWPTGGMPLHLMGDRGELISRQAEALSEGFNIDVENAPPYNGAAKGVVERTFGTKQTRFGPYTLGCCSRSAR